MKKIIHLFIIVLMGSMVASCHLNEMPTFDDKDVFAGFRSNSTNATEDCGTLLIPVNVTSLNGAATTVTYEFVNGSAKQGVDFEDASGTGTLSFGVGEFSKNITVKIINHPGVFTGDLKFSVRLKSAGDVKMGANNTISVTINDLDHPLSAILGSYSCKTGDAWGGDNEWTMTFMKDASDVSKVWIYNIFALDDWADMDTIFYGIVDEDMTTITIPLGQESEYKYRNGNPITLLGFDGESGYDEGNMVVSIKDGGKTLVWDPIFGPWAWIEGAGNLNILYGGFTCTKVN